MNKKITIDLIAIYFAKVAIFLVTIGQISLINKHFGVEVYGQLVMVISAVGFCASFITARSSEAVTRFYTRERMRKDDNLAKFVLILGSLVDLLTALLLFLIVLFFSEYISGFLFNGVGFSAVICTYSIAVFFSFLKKSSIS